MKIGQIVFSKAGRDKDKPLSVISSDNSGVFVVDGKERPLERPKLKNQKHIELTGNCLSEKELGSNKALRKALSQIKANNEF